MKKSISCLVLTAVFFLNANSQTVKKALQGQTWYVTGNYYTKPKNNITLNKDSTPGFDWKATFLPSGKLINSQITKESYFTSQGDETPPGYFMYDTACTYTINENTLIIDYSMPEMIRTVNYKLEALKGKKGYECVLINSVLKDR